MYWFKHNLLAVYYCLFLWHKYLSLLICYCVSFFQLPTFEFLYCNIFFYYISVGFFIPAKGFEKFYGEDVYLGFMFDSYDNNITDPVIGQVEETVETNNIAWSNAVRLVNLDDQYNTQVQKKCKLHFVQLILIVMW